jgi:hypothetical protein
MSKLESTRATLGWRRATRGQTLFKRAMKAM